MVQVLAALTEGVGINAATRLYGVSKNSIYRWQERLSGLKKPRVANLTRESYNGLLFVFLRVQKGTQCNRFLFPRCDVNDLKTPERVLLKLSLPSYKK